MCPIGSHFKDSMTISNPIAGFRDKTYDTPFTVKGRFEDDLVVIRGLSTMRDARGEEIQAKAVVYLPPGTNILNSAKVVFDGNTYEALNVGTMRRYGKKKFLEIFLV